MVDWGLGVVDWRLDVVDWGLGVLGWIAGLEDGLLDAATNGDILN